MNRDGTPTTDPALGTLDERTDLIFHITSTSAWRDAEETGEYRLSTKGRTLEEVGFVHCSFAHQVDVIANAMYAGDQDLVVLEIAPELVDSEIRYENLEGGAAVFPHVSGPLRPSAVVGIGELQVDDAGLMSFTR